MSSDKWIFLLRPPDVGIPLGEDGEISSKISGVILHQGDVLRAQTAGGGGVGDPLDRDPESVAIDVELGKVSGKHAREMYGVVLTKNRRVDQKPTAKLRNHLKSKE